MTDTLNIQINGKDHILNKDDCNKFMRPRGRNNNDHNNKVRELAIYCMVNNIIRDECEWLNDQRWLNLNNDVHEFLRDLVDGYQEYNPEMFVHFARDMSIFLEKLSQYSSYQPGTSKYSYFQTYYDYYQRVYSEHLENDPKLSELCFSDRRAFTCKDFTNLFFKHVSNEYTYALLPDPDGGLFSYDKNELVYSILGDDIWRFENVRQVGVSGNDDIIINDKLCLSKNRFREVRDEDEGVTRKYDFGAHMLKTYYESLSDFGYALPIS